MSKSSQFDEKKGSFQKWSRRVTGTRWHLQPHPFFSSPPDLLHLTSIFVSLLEEAILIFVEFKTFCCFDRKEFCRYCFLSCVVTVSRQVWNWFFSSARRLFYIILSFFFLSFSRSKQKEFCERRWVVLLSRLILRKFIRFLMTASSSKYFLKQFTWLPHCS